MRFAKKHRDWTLERWRYIMWSDESIIILFQHDGCLRGGREEAHEALHPSCTVSTVQASGGSVLICGCFSWAALGSATIYSKEMKYEYVSLFSDHLIPSMDYFFPKGDGIFQDDNAGTHLVRIVDN
ncbi:hypothetical protein AVEN_228845-1 [Araneus ventricosus]|uniref:Transposable element Tc1 transposase n=1 Tax=Araneus ventricosus TaxID=182803 RepID=A0A4Y2W8F3_ARAVE|nr:hypothetical protein AVEN_232230-1 [Araneus ventricosus]GBO33506.1 hypothetical protein AVEN_233434-1 [Araneus ventricosus]GBO33511.1 hypothetical protein AVEN_171179-1 [Araneus ventricosus]GBO33705.1 hypothetical protein AVEN_228845-1 [Araneus ventricosus]